MANYEVIMPKMGESIEEATITNWFVSEGDKVEEDDVLLEIATDKVDSEIPSPVEGVVKKILFNKDQVVPVGTVVAIIEMEGEASGESEEAGKEEAESETSESVPSVPDENSPDPDLKSTEGRFYSPLVKKIAGEEGISQEELDSIPGSGLNGRVQKKDVLTWLENRAGAPVRVSGSGREETAKASSPAPSAPAKSAPVAPPSLEGGDDLVEMSRLRKLIAANMVKSVQTSAHVTNMIEVDVTNVVNWRTRVKSEFQEKEGVRLTYLPVFLSATVKALKDFPQINASVEGDHIRFRKQINLGVAVALPDNNLIVPNIKNVDTLNIRG